MKAALIALVVPGLLATDGAWAHSAPQGWRYDGTCCSAVEPSAHTGDCAPIPDSAVRVVPGGYEVTLRPGDHPLVTREHHWFVPHDRPMTPGNISQPAVRPSGDNSFHSCLFPSEDTLRCLYIKYGGV